MVTHYSFAALNHPSWSRPLDYMQEKVVTRTQEEALAMIQVSGGGQ